MKIICKQCNKEFQGRNRKGRSAGKSVFCSRICSDTARRKENLCIVCGKDFKRTSHAKIDYCSKDCMIKSDYYKKFKTMNIGKTAWNKGKPAPWARWDKLFDPEVRKLALKKSSEASSKRKGELHHNWKGGVSPERKRLMQQKEYIFWRTAVFMRDDYTCQICSVRGGTLHADHIKPWALYPELRYAIDNGRTLCVNCHKQTDTWGGKSMYRERGR